MRPPKTPIDFDYDLWTTEDDKCMVRVKRTGEVCEVDRTTMRLLRAEEKKLRRSKTGVPIIGTSGATEDERASVLSLSFVSIEGGEDMEPSWLIDPNNMVEEIIFQMQEEEFRNSLTEKQLDVYVNCILRGQSQRQYAEANGVAQQTVSCVVVSIRKKAKKFFEKKD